MAGGVECVRRLPESMESTEPELWEFKKLQKPRTPSGDSEHILRVLTVMQ